MVERDRLVNALLKPECARLGNALGTTLRDRDAGCTHFDDRRQTTQRHMHCSASSQTGIIWQARFCRQCKDTLTAKKKKKNYTTHVRETAAEKGWA